MASFCAPAGRAVRIGSLPTVIVQSGALKRPPSVPFPVLMSVKLISAPFSSSAPPLTVAPITGIFTQAALLVSVPPDSSPATRPKSVLALMTSRVTEELSAAQLVTLPPLSTLPATPPTPPHFSTTQTVRFRYRFFSLRRSGQKF